jgi:predicted transcriptional regulator
MITIHLDPSKEQRLQELAVSQGQDTSQLAGRVLEDYLDAQAWSEDRDEDWADASVAMAPEVMSQTDWSHGDAQHGPR